ncbi:hypothetical protein BDZ94DRAFT_1290119 [Collybia nuda]|uniref:Arrestin C-terminal-like domain-containing protein n=1 Tax=Collybia nuda TaxID=64659 RepID=A0A9P5Y7R1_9AGAR|nr:hypothetical protein BDZ94DRAFT_1290119 [Collybia nuda]
MAHVKLTLRPPPNVDFVVGYPGIPPSGPDRPQALVKGAIELRAGQQGVKAKWVRIELRKVETLPGGGSANIYSDYVGPSPVNLWTSSDEYGILRTQDFPFSIRIPESIPPSIALEHNAGIQYELVGTVCVKGKRGFFRKRKSVVSSVNAPIIIDKHELHSTWPVYNQSESRSINHEAITLTVERSQTCYGPGDRVVVNSTVKSDSLGTLILRGFDISLRETTAYQAGHYSSKKSVPPQPRSVNISENKFPVNKPLYGGTQFRTELACVISPNHTTTSLNTARHIDITYILCVKALVDTMPPIIMELPVVISNWQRNVSAEAIRRIGPTPNLSLLPIPSQQISQVDPAPRSPHMAATLPIGGSRRTEPDSPGTGVGRNPSANSYNTLPSQTNQYHGGHSDELGYGAGLGFNPKAPHSHSNSITSNSVTDEFGSRAPAPTATVSNPTGVGKRPNSGQRPTSAGRLTIINAVPGEIPQQDTTTRDRSGSVSGGSTTSRNWPTAGEEKQRYERARAKVQQKQGSVTGANTPPPAVVTPVSSHPSEPTVTTAKNPHWPSAEEEKQRLFHKAQAAAARTQKMETYSPASSVHNRINLSSSGAPTSKSKPRTPAEIYAQGMSAMNEPASRVKVKSPKKTPPIPQYRTAEEEKAALRRYEQAKQAVDRVQNTGYSSDESQIKASSNTYESSYPKDRGASSSSPAPLNDMPPPFEATPSVIPASYISEKERYRRAYEMQDAARQNAALVSPPPFSAEPYNPNQGLPEKEILRRKFEAQDPDSFSGTIPNSPPQPPPRSMSANSTVPPSPPAHVTPSTTRTPSTNARTNRPTPAPPISPGRIMTAAEEKALLKAQYAAEDARAAKPRANGYGPGRPESSSARSQPPPSTPPPPPPLMPRPPVEYIQETQEEDARVSRFVGNGTLPLDDDLHGARSPPLNMMPFTPFTAGFESTLVKIPGPPPPLPPKPEGE